MNIKPAKFSAITRGCWIAACLLLFCNLAVAYPLSLEQRNRLKRYLPNTLPKLDGKDPVHVALLGGGNLYGASNLADDRLDGDALTSYAGVFLDRVANLFFYTGGVKLLNPPPGGKEKIEAFQGNEITIENLAMPYGTIYNGLQKVQSQLFLHKPDIVMIQYGATDALNNCSTFAYRWALDIIVSECKKRNVDVILVGPTPVNKGSGIIEWGASRRYTSSARGIAAGHDAIFFDAGRSLIRWAGFIDPESAPNAGMAVVSDKLDRLFFVPGYDGKELQHINKKAHQDLGRQLFDELMDGQDRPDLKASGRAILGEGGTVKVLLTLQNLTNKPKKGVLGALSLGQITPTGKTTAQRFSIPASGKKAFTFIYVRPIVGESETGANIYHPLEIFDEKGLRFAFLVEDGSKTEFLELPPLATEPISVNWLTQQVSNITDQFQVDWKFQNALNKAISGTYRIGFGDVLDEPKKFSIPAKGSKTFGINLPFTAPSSSNCFQRELFLEVDVGGNKYRFARELEATRDLVLAEKVHMVNANYINAPAGLYNSGQDENWAPSVSFDAVDNGVYDQSGLYCLIDLNGLNLPTIQDGFAIKATLTLDGRPKEADRGFGAVSELDFYFKQSVSNGMINHIPIGAFGNGYNKRLSTQGLKSVFQNNQIAIKIPKAYLDKLDWSFTKESVAGVGLKLSIADSSNPQDRFPISHSFSTNFPGVNFKGNIVSGMTAEDPRGLCTLRFTRTPVNTWYARIY